MIEDNVRKSIYHLFGWHFQPGYDTLYDLTYTEPELPHYLFIVRQFYKTIMPQAFVLMNAELGSEDSIVQDLKKLDGVKEVFQVYGVYDIVAQLEADTMEKVKETITWKLRKLNGVKSTLTMIVMS